MQRRYARAMYRDVWVSCTSSVRRGRVMLTRHRGPLWQRSRVDGRCGRWLVAVLENRWATAGAATDSWCGGAL